MVWINGAFGVGKTAVAKRLCDEWTGSALFDPEKLARLIRNATPAEQRPNDYQDAPLWRRMTVQAITGLADASEVVVVPMTLIDERYFREIVGGLRQSGQAVHHFALTATPNTIRRSALEATDDAICASKVDPLGAR